MNTSLNHDHDEARSLHRIVRAMHDGECPKCHVVSPSDEMRRWKRVAGVQVPDGWQCPVCDFAVSKKEGDEVFRIFAPFMERNLAVFEKWRESRKQSSIPTP